MVLLWDPAIHTVNKPPGALNQALDQGWEAGLGSRQLAVLKKESTNYEDWDDVGVHKS